MSKERLEEIKDKYMDAEYDFNLNKHDINWLIEQAGLEQSHSEKIDELHIFLQDNIKIKDGYLGMHVIDVAIEGIKGQNKRIRDLEQKIRVDSELFDMLEQQNKRYRMREMNCFTNCIERRTNY